MMRAFPLLLIGASLLASGCKAGQESGAFDKKFRGAKLNSGLKQLQHIGSGGAGELQGNVQRLGAPTPPPTAVTSRRIPIKLTQNQVGRIIRRQLVRLTECQRAAKGKSGKALLTVRIESSGRVSRVSVSAPAFRGTRLARCLKKGAKRWRFPRFKKGPLTYTYPFIFR